MVSHENGFDDFLLGQRPGPLFYAGISSFRVVVVMQGRHRRWRSVHRSENILEASRERRGIIALLIEVKKQEQRTEKQDNTVIQYTTG